MSWMPGYRDVLVRGRERRLHLARHQLGDRVADEVADVGHRVGRDVEELALGDPCPGIAGDVADRVAAALAGGEPGVGDLADELRRVRERHVVDLDVLARGDVALAQRGVVLDRVREGLHLLGGDAAQRQLDADHLHVGLALAVDALLEAEADELVLGDLAPHEPGGLGVEVVELPLDDRDHVAGDVLVDLGVLERADPALAGLVLVADLQLVLGGDALGHRADADQMPRRRALHGCGLHRRSITQILTGFRAFTAGRRLRDVAGRRPCRCSASAGSGAGEPGATRTRLPRLRASRQRARSQPWASRRRFPRSGRRRARGRGTRRGSRPGCRC